MNNRFTVRSVLGLALIIISSFLGYNWLAGDSAATVNDGYSVGSKIMFYDVRLHDVDSAIYTSAMTKCNTEDATCFGFVKNGQKSIDVELTVTRMADGKVWLSDGEGDALECDVNTIDTRNIRFLMCGEDIRTNMVTRQVAGLNATLTDAEAKQASEQAEYCHNNTSLMCWASTGLRDGVIGFVAGLFQ